MKIVTTIDFSTTSEPLLKITKTYAEKMGAEVFLVHAEPVRMNFDQEEYDTTPEAVRLKRDAKALERTGIKVTPVFVQGPVCETILSEALKLGADLIIIGAHGHGEMSCKLPVGHVSQCVMLGSKIPVMIVPNI